MIRKHLLQLIFSGACMWRWNDKLRPVELTEIEKQAHKMLVAFALFHQASLGMERAEALELSRKIIEGGLFDYFYRLIITDIKPPVFYKIKENKEHYSKLTEFTLSRLEPLLAPLGPFWERMKIWHQEQDKEGDIDRRILKASHLFASQWEFNLIRPHNHFDDEMEGIARSFTDDLEKFKDLPGMEQLLNTNNALGKFANLCGQLRFQIRWAQAPRLPATSVLGHMFIVAAYAYMFSLAIGASQARANNNFFSGLLHDFPELLTRDIITPVKKSFAGLADIIKEYETSEMECRVLAPLRKAGFNSFTDRISYFLGLEIGSEFQDCCLIEGKVVPIDIFKAPPNHYDNKFDARDGTLLKCCDLLAAYMEAHNSIINGVSTSALVESRARIKSDLLSISPECLHMDALLADFD